MLVDVPAVAEVINEESQRLRGRDDVDRSRHVRDPECPPGLTVRTAAAGVDESLLHELVERSFAGH
jgi:hypothetical protein